MEEVFNASKLKLSIYATSDIIIKKKIIFLKKKANDNFSLDLFINIDNKLVNFDFSKYTIKSFKSLDELQISKVLDYSIEKILEYNYFYNIRTPKYKLAHRKNRCFFVSVEVKPEDKMNLPEIKIEDLLESGVHYGHNVRRWNPKMQEYIYGVRNNIHIFDLRITVDLLNAALVKFMKL